MKQVEDKYTRDLLEKRPGRPVTGSAMTAAERMRKYRAAKARGPALDDLLIQVADRVNDADKRDDSLFDVISNLLQAVDLPDDVKAKHLARISRQLAS